MPPVFSFIVNFVRNIAGTTAAPPGAKPAESSATLWLNGILALASFLVAVSPQVISDPNVAAWLAEHTQVAAFVTGALAVANWILRAFKTTEAVK